MRRHCRSSERQLVPIREPHREATLSDSEIPSGLPARVDPSNCRAGKASRRWFHGGSPEFVPSLLHPGLVVLLCEWSMALAPIHLFRSPVWTSTSFSFPGSQNAFRDPLLPCITLNEIPCWFRVKQLQCIAREIRLARTLPIPPTASVQHHLTSSIPFLILLSLQFLRSFVRRGSGNCRSDASVNLCLSHFSWTCDNSGSKGALHIQTKFISDPSYLFECKTLEDRAP
jgi:hypothetical protein